MANPLKDIDKSAEESYKKARISFQMGDFEESLKTYQKAEKAWEEMASRFSEAGKETREKEYLEKAQEARSCSGMALFKLARYQDALEIVDSVLEIRPESAIEWSNKGFVLSALERNEEALEAFEKALSYAPEAPKILTNIGIVYFKMGAFEKALEIFDKALNLEPKKASDWACKIPRFSFFSKNKTVMRPDNGQTWNWKGNVFLALGEKEKALNSFKMALDSDPDQVDSLLSGGKLLCEFAEYEESFKCYARALKLSPGNETAKQGKEFCELKLNNLQLKNKLTDR